MGSGPFTISEYEKGQFVELVKDPYYWGNSAGMAPQVDRLVYRIFGNQDAAGGGRCRTARSTSATSLREHPQHTQGQSLETRGATIPSFGEIGMNIGSPYQIDNDGGIRAARGRIRVPARSRRAPSDPASGRNQTFVSKVLLGYGTAGISPVQPGGDHRRMDAGAEDPDLSFNLQAASDMLEQAGYTMGPDEIRSAPRRTSRSSSVSTADRNQYSIDIVPYVKDWLKQIGSRSTPRRSPAPSLGT